MPAESSSKIIHARRSQPLRKSSHEEVMDWRAAVEELRKTGAQMVEFLKETAFELSWDARDAAQTGFGVPKLMSSAASLGVATVAGAGVASVAFDFGGKIWGKRECTTCNGWEGLRCQICNGAGRVRYIINESTLSDSERSTSRSVAEAALDGRASVDYVVPGSSPNFPFPNIDCPQCDGTGVMTCSACSGSPWVPKFTVARAMNAPWLAWDAYRKIQPPSEPKDNLNIGTSTMDAELFVDNLKGDRGDVELMQATIEKQKEKMEYDIIREEVEKRGPMWEKLQEVLTLKNPLRAVRDDVIEMDPSYYKAKMKILNEVQDLPVPARPADWLNITKPLSESDWTNKDLEDPKMLSEMRAILAGQEDFYQKLLERTWENHWRTQKFEEMKEELIASYERDKDGHQRPEPRQTNADMGASSPTVPRKGREKLDPGRRVDGKKRFEDDKKRRERQERSERMAKQAADREAALMRAKAAREGKDER